MGDKAHAFVSQSGLGRMLPPCGELPALDPADPRKRVFIVSPNSGWGDTGTSMAAIADALRTANLVVRPDDWPNLNDNGIRRGDIIAIALPNENVEWLGNLGIISRRKGANLIMEAPGNLLRQIQLYNTSI